MNFPDLRRSADRLTTPAVRDGLRVGVIASGADGKVVVAFAGGGQVECRYVHGYEPEVGDQVQVLYSGPGLYTVLGKMSADQTSSAVVTEVTHPTLQFAGKATSPSWTWSVGAGAQGKPDSTQPAHAAVWYFDSSYFDGKTVLALSVIVRRPGTRWILTRTGSWRTPRLYLHSHAGQPSGSPSWDSDVWSPGALFTAEAAAFAVPSEWKTALTTGTSLGFGAYSAALGDWMDYAAPSYLVTYTT